MTGIVFILLHLLVVIVCFIEQCECNQRADKNNRSKTDYGLSLTYFMCLPYFAWMITATVLRFDELGKICSGYYLSRADKDLGDSLAVYMLEEGEFLKNVILCLWCLPGGLCLLGCCFSLGFNEGISR